MTMLYRFLSVLLLVVSCSTAAARWATFQDANVEILAYKSQINVNLDGTAEKIIELKIKMINESGRDSYSTFPLSYNHDNSTLEILEAKTIVEGHEYNLDADLIEDKPLASAVSGFDQQHQVLLAFPNTKVNAVIFLKYKVIITKPDLPGFFETFFDGGFDYISNSDVSIKSAAPLYINFNDPDKYLDVKQGKSGKYFTAEIKLRKPIYIKTIDETGGLFNPNKRPWVYVTTNKSWQNFGQQLAAPFNLVLQQPLPELYKNIAAAAKQEKDPIAQINIVTSKLNESVQYMGDWKTSKGRHIPQDLDKVANKHLGDCKDFATGTAAILNSLGMQANVVLVQRGAGIYDSSYIKLPGFIHFNHAMVKVTVAGKTLWIDPTNFFSIADRILSDIDGRQALVLYANGAKLEQIPSSKVQDKIVINEQNLEFLADDILRVKGTMTLQGLAAIRYTGAELQVSKQTIDNHVLYEQSSFDNIIDKSVFAPNLTSRIVSDLTFKFEFTEKNSIMHTNAGDALLITNSLAGKYIFNDEQVSDAYMGSPGISRNIIVINNIVPVNTLNLDYTISSPWVDAKRKVTYKKDSVIIEQEFVNKQSFISNDVLKSKAYKKVADELANNFKEGVAIVFTK